MAATFLGYKSLSGTANKALSALSTYGLVERAGKGMMRITSRAKSILHPHDESERLSALRDAGMEPRLFQEIRDRFPDHDVPPEEGVRSHLNREGFNPNVVSSAVKAVMELLNTSGKKEQPKAMDILLKRLLEQTHQAQSLAGRSLAISFNGRAEECFNFQAPQRLGGSLMMGIG